MKRALNAISRSLLTGLCLALLATPAAAQDEAELDFKKLIEAGEYEALGEKLRGYLDLERADPALRRYLEMNLEYLERGARPAQSAESAPTKKRDGPPSRAERGALQGCPGTCSWDQCRPLGSV